MSVVNPEATVKAIGTWIQERLTEAHATTAVVGVSGGADSALVASICKRNNIPTVGVLMPCHSSPDSVARAREMVAQLEIPFVEVNLEAAFSSIVSQTTFSTFKSASPQVHLANNASEGALRSCLRAPTLDYVAKLTNGLIVGTGNRDEDEVTRYFQKRGDGAVDISPIAKLHKSEVYELLRYLKAPASIINAVPSADLWGPNAGQEDEKELGLSYADVEWGIRELNDTVYGWDIRDDIRSGSTTYLSTYTPQQVNVLTKLVNMDNASSHKSEGIPVFSVRTIPGLVK